MSKPLAFKTPERIGDEHPNVFTKPSDVNFVGERGRVESEDEQAGVPSLAIAKCGEAANVRDSVTPEIRQNLVLSHMPEFRSEYCTFAGVAALMERDGDLFSAEDSGVQKSLGGRARGGLQN